MFASVFITFALTPVIETQSLKKNYFYLLRPKGSELLPQTQIFQSLYLCNLWYFKLRLFDLIEFENKVCGKNLVFLEKLEGNRIYFDHTHLKKCYTLISKNELWRMFTFSILQITIFMILAKHEKVAKYLAKTNFFQNKVNFKFNPIHVFIFFQS